MNVFQQYGIKEVADVCLYAIELDENDDEVYVPVLYLDTLKVSTVEQTAESTSAQGGLGNPRLITWDYGKEITVTLEDALYSPASQGMTWGGKMGAKTLKLYLRNFFDRGTDSKNPNANLRSAILTINNFSDFLTIPDRWPAYELKNQNSKQNTTGYVSGTSIYCWLVDGNIISNDGKKRVFLNDLILFFREQTQKWYFFNGNGPVIGDAYSYKKLENKPYAIQYQYGRDAFEWIRNNLSGDNFEKWESYVNGNWTDSNSKSNVVPFDKATEDEYRWTEYEETAINTMEDWITDPPCEKYERGPEYSVMGAEVAFLTQNLYIDGYRTDKCARNRLYSEMTEDEKLIQGYEPYRYSTSVDVIYNTNVVPPHEAIYQIDHDIDNVFYLDRMEKCRATTRFCIDTDVNLKHGQYRYLEKYANTELTVYIDPKTMQPYEPNSAEYYRKNGQRITGNLRVFKQYDIYYKWTRTKAYEHTSLGNQIVIDATHFPGTYRLVGETYSRNRKTGKDQRYQFEIPLCKMGSENNLTLQADGDPTTFTMTLTAMRRADGVMMKLTQYDVVPKKYGKYTSGSTEIVPFDGNYEPTDEQLDDASVTYESTTLSTSKTATITSLNIIEPTDGQVYNLTKSGKTSLEKNNEASSGDSDPWTIEVAANVEETETTTKIWTREDSTASEPVSYQDTTSKVTSQTVYLSADDYEATLTPVDNNI